MKQMEKKEVSTFYIPIWFDLNKAPTEKKDLSNEFTFQYGSI